MKVVIITNLRDEIVIHPSFLKSNYVICKFWYYCFLSFLSELSGATPRLSRLLPSLTKYLNVFFLQQHGPTMLSYNRIYKILKQEKTNRGIVFTRTPDQAISKTSESVLNKLENAPNPMNNIAPKPIPVIIPICTTTP